MPEDVFGLLSLVPAGCGGGDSLLLTRDDLISRLAARPDGADVLHTLRTVEIPFVVPSVFKRSSTSDREYVFARVLDGEGVRFRTDAVETALAAMPERNIPEVRVAVDAMTAALREPTLRLRLAAGDLLFIDNRRVLHGRTAFADPARHLLRVRLRWSEA